jgi:tetratricopeptide (TPR) repeat protein
MQRRFKAASLVLLAGLSLSLVGCGEVNKLKAKKAYKQAIEMYRQQDYKRAADKYKEAVDLDPELTAAYFYLANSYDNQFKATKRGDATNDAYLTSAIKYYQVAADRDPDPKLRKWALQYLFNDYGSEKMNDPAQAEAIIQKMIQMEPNDTGNYFALAKLYDDAGVYDQEEQALVKAQQIKPNDPGVYGQLAGFYNRQGDFEKTMDAYEQWKKIEPNNPEVYYTIASFYWDKAYHDQRLKEADKRRMVSTGLDEVDKALQIKSDYIDAIVRKGLLLRVQAGLEKDRTKYDDLMKQAQSLTDKATALQKKKVAGVTK